MKYLQYILSTFYQINIIKNIQSTRILPLHPFSRHTGNVFIVETDNQKVRLVSGSGIITTFAGSGATGASGDGGLAVNAQLNNPQAVAVDLVGTYVHPYDKIQPISLHFTSPCL